MYSNTILLLLIIWDALHNAQPYDLIYIANENTDSSRPFNLNIVAKRPLKTLLITEALSTCTAMRVTSIKVGFCGNSND